jgi:hypothetical protein
LEFYDVSLPNFTLAAGEQVERLECVVSGAIARTNVPLEWNISIDNGTGGRSKLIGYAVVGAAAFDSNHLSYFQDLLRVAKMKVPPSGSLESQFDVNITLSISDRNDATRKLKFSMKQLILKPVQ